MDDVFLYLCPHVNIRDLVKTKELVLTYYNERHMAYCFYSTMYQQEEKLTCQNCNSEEFVHDHGDITCTQCGHVYLDHCLMNGYVESSTVSDYMFSESHQFQSHFNDHKKNSLYRTSKLTDKKLKSMTMENLTTSDYYKDAQRDEVYSTLDNMKEVVNVPSEVIDKAKEFYNVYRSHMVRIHKLPLVLASIIWIVMDSLSSS